MKNINSKVKLFSAILLVGVLSACEKEYYEPVPTPTEVSFAADMQPFFDAKCTVCHKGAGIPLNLLSGVSYDEITNGSKTYIDAANPSNSLFYTKIIDGGSMAGYANATERSLTLSWIEQGAKNN